MHNRRTVVMGGLSILGLTSKVEAMQFSKHVPPMSQLIRHPLLVESVYQRFPRDKIAQNGAVGINRHGIKFIEIQRLGCELILYGIATHHPTWITKGWKALDYGLMHQAHDGSFPGSDLFHSSSLFLESLARAMLVDPSGATELRKNHLRLAVDWLTDPAVEARGKNSNAPFTHRRYILAATLGEAGAILKDEKLALKATEYAQEGLTLQRSDGVNPERGGFDVNYQQVGVLACERYLPVCSNAALTDELLAMMSRALRVVLQHISRNGRIDPSGSTRVNGEETTREGKIKGVNPGETIQTLVFGAQILDKSEWLDAARHIIHFYAYD